MIILGADLVLCACACVRGGMQLQNSRNQLEVTADTKLSTL